MQIYNKLEDGQKCFICTFSKKVNISINGKPTFEVPFTMVTESLLLLDNCMQITERSVIEISWWEKMLFIGSWLQHVFLNYLFRLSGGWRGQVVTVAGVHANIQQRLSIY